MPPDCVLHWSDDFLLGYEAMDDTHREFVDCVGRLSACGDEEFLDCLRAFIAHAESHFGQEDAWMDETGFPAGECHKEEHAKVLESAREVLPLVAAGNVAIGRLLTEELVRWFPGHADYMDSALAHWMSKKKFGGAPVVLRRAVGQTRATP